MKRIILAGISASLLASMALTACDGKQATLKGENSVPISSATITSENTSSDIALTSSQAASSVAVSSKKATSSKDTVNEYPITYLAAMPSGRSITFSKGSDIDAKSIYESSSWINVKIIKSLSELQLICNNRRNSPELPKQYNSDFFQNNALIVVRVARDGITTPADQVKDLKITDSTLGISMTTWLPAHTSGTEQPCVIGEIAIELVVKKSDITHISKIEIYIKNENN